LLAREVDRDERIEIHMLFSSLKCFFVMCVAALATIAAPHKVSWEPVVLENGMPCLFRVEPQIKLQSLRGRWLDQDIVFDLDRATGIWFAVVGVSLDTSAGEHALQLKGTSVDGRPVEISQEVPVREAKYPQSSLSVSSQFTEPDKKALERIKAEQEIKREAFANSDPERLWGGVFKMPVPNVTTAQFGTRRVLNGSVRSVHQGLDFRAPTGTPIAAIARGRVVIARPMFYEGNFIVIDHGRGWTSLYMHLSKFDVKDGDVVVPGQIIGLSGGTGRVTGPHLHLGIRWRGVMVNPSVMLKLRLPDFPQGSENR